MEKDTALRKIIIILIFLTPLSCATGIREAPGSSQDETLYRPVRLGSRAPYRLLPPEYLEKPMDTAQRISGFYGETEFAMNAWVQADGEGVRMAFFNGFGAGMGDLAFDRRGASFSSAFLPSSLEGEYIIADFQLCFYQIPALAAALKKSGLTIKTETAEGRETRRIFEGPSLIITIEKTPSLARYTNHLRGYSYTLEGDF